MIKAQRKVHRNIWFIMALHLPVLLVLAVLSRPQLPKETPSTPSLEAVGDILREVDSKEIKVNIRGSEQGPSQLEIVVKIPLQAASAMVYTGAGVALGQIGTRGVYRFPIEQIPASIKVSDLIKNQDLMTIEL